MSSVITQAPNILPGTEQLPLPAIICIAIGCYIFIVAVALIIKQCLQSRGMCGEVQCCGKEGDPCCACCLTIAQACNCCQSPSVKGCMDRCCPNRRHFDCVDIILCQCCTPPGPGKDPLCGLGPCECLCTCSIPNCDVINCWCFQIHMNAGGGPARRTAVVDAYSGSVDDDDIVDDHPQFVAVRMQPISSTT